ncbi:hypothetical protein E4U26_000092 [Claviceps purpurea]|nr:hypothetical protein E4U26_000092 [Claviceps purpurea]
MNPAMLISWALRPEISPGRSIEQIFEYTYTPLETAGKPDDYAYRITTAEHRHNVAAPSRTLEATRVARTTEYKICSAVTSWLPRREPDHVEVLRATDADTRVLATSPKVEAVQLDGLSVLFNGVMWISSYILA